MTSRSARVYGNRTLLGAPTVATLDLDGVNGVGLNGLSVWLTDFESGVPNNRDDFDHGGAVGINDLAVLLTAFSAGASVSSCASDCP